MVSVSGWPNTFLETFMYSKASEIAKPWGLGLGRHLIHPKPSPNLKSYTLNPKPPSLMTKRKFR